MEPLVEEAVAHADRKPSRRLTWEDPAVKHVLDVLVKILAEEYIQTVKRNPGVFSPNGGAP